VAGPATQYRWDRTTEILIGLAPTRMNNNLSPLVLSQNACSGEGVHGAHSEESSGRHSNENPIGCPLRHRRDFLHKSNANPDLRQFEGPRNNDKPWMI
jgi:hypothetical protein